jgi:hypothetical protein
VLEIDHQQPPAVRTAADALDDLRVVLARRFKSEES